MDVTRVTPASLADGDPLLIDVRTGDERAAGHIAGSLHLPLDRLDDLPRVVTELDRPIVFYCATGVRSETAAEAAAALGYRTVASLAGGFERWRADGLGWVGAEGLSREQLERYARHLALPGVGLAGQARLLDSRVAVVGAGGLGSPVSLYLAAAGVGTLTLIDHDLVDATNLQRQVIHSIDHVGKPKTDSARERIAALNPDVKVGLFSETLAASNALRLLGGHDVVIDATDNFPTRYLINDASINLGIPVIHASIYRFEGQVSVFDPDRGPCYRCLFPLPPPPGIAATCDTGGVLGVLPGVIGTIQATEALKVLLGVGETLTGRLLLYDALTQRTSELTIARQPDCPACSPASKPPQVVDYDATCRPR